MTYLQSTAVDVFSAARPRRKSRSVILCLLGTLLMLLTAALARAGTIADLDQDNGLPDAKLGTPLKNFQGLEKTEDTGRWLSYKRPADKLRYDKFEISGITYNFFKEKLYSIDIDVLGKHNVKGLLKLLESNYGKQHTLDTKTYPKTTATMEVREWSGARAYCVYKSAADFTGAVLVFVDKPTWDLLQVPKNEQQSHNRDLLKGSFINGDF